MSVMGTVKNGRYLETSLSGRLKVGRHEKNRGALWEVQAMQLGDGRIATNIKDYK